MRKSTVDYMLWLLERNATPDDFALERVKLLLREESAKLAAWGVKLRAGRERRQNERQAN